MTGLIIVRHSVEGGREGGREGERGGWWWGGGWGWGVERGRRGEERREGVNKYMTVYTM